MCNCECHIKKRMYPDKGLREPTGEFRSMLREMVEENLEKMKK